LVKGGDYNLDTIVGADIVRATEGEVKVLSFVEGISTTTLYEKIWNLMNKSTWKQ
jgi:D-beta-D-heptose 7-phosphate kinase/D-beta-D-heptose 1-phosphate adenosyltransferase